MAQIIPHISPRLILFTSLHLTFYNLLFASSSPKLAVVVVVVVAVQSAFKTESAEETVT
jgi:hypothetical protein